MFLFCFLFDSSLLSIKLPWKYFFLYKVYAVVGFLLFIFH